MCRASFVDPVFIPEVDVKLQQLIKKEMGPKFEEAKKIAIKEERYVKGKIVRFTYGNTWEDVPIEKPANEEQAAEEKPAEEAIPVEFLKTNNKWTMELSINDGEEISGKFIEGITYYMYPSSEAHANAPPFRVERVSQDYFDLIIKIRFRPEYQ